MSHCTMELFSVQCLQVHNVIPIIVACNVYTVVLVGVVLNDLLGGTTGCINFIQVVVFSKATM